MTDKRPLEDDRSALCLSPNFRISPKFLAEGLAKWQLPDAFVFLDVLQRTSVGKFKKIALRKQFANWKWDS